MTATGDLQRRLRELLRERSVAHGDFMLASGHRSSVYIDARRTTMSGEGFALIGALGLERLDARGWAPTLVGGLTLGAGPVAYAIVAAAHARGRPLDAFTVRKQAKAHGTGQRIEGVSRPEPPSSWSKTGSPRATRPRTRSPRSPGRGAGAWASSPWWTGRGGA